MLLEGLGKLGGGIYLIGSRTRDIIIIIIIIMALQPSCWPLANLFQFLDHTHIRQDSLDGGSARRKTFTYTQGKPNRINTHTDIHASSGIRTQHLSVSADESSSRLRPRGHCDGPYIHLPGWKIRTHTHTHTETKDFFV
jgi:hypothetical protein